MVLIENTNHKGRRVVNGAKQIKCIVKGKEVLISPLCLCFFSLRVHAGAVNLVIPGFICKAIENGFPFK